MIQNLGNKIEAQVNRLEARIEKIREMFNKELEDLKNSQSAMNNTITDIKNTLEGISSRITEVEEWISKLEDRKVEIAAKEQNKGKRMKRTEDSLSYGCHFLLQGIFPTQGSNPGLLHSRKILYRQSNQESSVKIT